MNLLSAIMGLADLVCIIAIFASIGFNTFTVILAIIMIPKGVMSFL